MTTEEFRGLLDWDMPLPWRWRLKRDRRRSAPTLVPWGFDPQKLRRRAHEIEEEQRLYLRLADAIVKPRDGRPELREDWQQRALSFADLYAPPTGHSWITLTDSIPLAEVAREARLLWWTLRLVDQLRAEDRSLDGAIEAIVHIHDLVGGDRDQAQSVLSFVPDPWITILTTMPPRADDPQRTYRLWRRGDKDKRLLATLQVYDTDYDGSLTDALEQGGFITHGRTRGRSASRSNITKRVREIRTQYSDNPDGLWQLAGNTLASVLNIRLLGVTPLCSPPPDPRRPGQLSVGFQFHSPLARIWYGLWEDVGALQLRFCGVCSRPFIAKRKDSRYCSPRCRNVGNVRLSRARPPA